MTTNMDASFKLTALYYKHLELGAKMIEVEGWLVAERYTDPEKEIDAATRSACITDIGIDAKIDVKGRGMDPFLVDLLKTDRIPKQPGQVVISARDGKWLPIKYACRLASDHSLLIIDGPPSLSQNSPLNVEPSKIDHDVHLTNVTSVFAGIRLIGPDSLSILKKLSQVDLPNLACAQGGVAKVHALIIRSDARFQGDEIYSFDLFFGRDYGEYMWDALIEAGSEFHITPLGAEACKRIQAKE
jgi:glycine cleavage system aminomethyltransferase T